MRRLHVFVALFLSLPARAVTIDWVAVGNANNAADTPSANCWAANCGSVDHAYSISKYEVTNAQYAEFLNAVGQNGAITRALFNASMHNNPNGGIVQSGVSGSFTYTAFPGFENKPVNFVSFYDSLRFANWLHNGQGDGDTETGAYTLLGGTAIPSNGLTVTRNPGASVFLPSENEWYKAAYYSPGGVYFDYPAGTDNAIECACAGLGHRQLGELQRRIGRTHDRRRLRSIGEPLRHVRPGRQHDRVERADRLRLVPWPPWRRLVLRRQQPRRVEPVLRQPGARERSHRFSRRAVCFPSPAPDCSG